MCGEKARVMTANELGVGVFHPIVWVPFQIAAAPGSCVQFHTRAIARTATTRALDHQYQRICVCRQGKYANPGRGGAIVYRRREND